MSSDNFKFINDESLDYVKTRLFALKDKRLYAKVMMPIYLTEQSSIEKHVYAVNDH